MKSYSVFLYSNSFEQATMAKYNNHNASVSYIHIAEIKVEALSLALPVILW